ncbi:LexA family protein [Intestinimonas massiliensis (ex Afouda et al. 2020)]|uniref:LexA family protein n=1 Tax=Intestinimonas massiliensis (ex Afouda et al. 2020) TaxID=1673721 RepID=UPI0010301F1E|nr:LexA family transcriptional regulator [Intestinimonas massiliensis (ex Afouda et al. 2020)]
MKQESSIGARLRTVMAEQGLSYEQLGERLHMNPQTLNRYVLGQREPKIGTAAAMARALGVDPLWLQGFDVPRVPAPQPMETSVVPILGTIRAGTPLLAQQDLEGYAAANVPDPEECFYLRVTGNSMINAGIREGDLVLLRRQETAENGQIVACLVDGEDATLKRFRVQKGVVILQPENPDYEPKIIPLRDFETGAARIIGVAVKLVRNL